MDTEKEKKSDKTKELLPYLLLIGVAGIGFNLYYKYDRYYLGETLTSKIVYIDEKPEYIYSKRGTSRYSFKGTNYNCQFWLSEGALTSINSDNQIKSEIESVTIGDTIEIKIRATDELKLQDNTARPRVIELIKGTKTVISASEVQKEDTKWFYINFGVPILSCLTWLVIVIKQQISKRNKIG